MAIYQMNEKLKQLYLCTFAPSISDSAVCEEGAKKFAELIVKECAEVAHCNFHVDGVTLGNIMKEHFGVEE